MDTDNPNGSSDYATPDRDVEIDRIRAGTESAYVGAYRIAVETLAATGLSGPASGTFGMDRDQAQRLVAHVLGAALLELEAPWRDALEHTQSELRSYGRTIAMMEGELSEVRRRLEHSEAAYLYASSIEGEQRERAETAEYHRERARDLAVRLEGELAELTHVAGVVLDQASGDGARVLVRREALERLAAVLRPADDATGRIPATDPEETDR